MAPRIYTSPVPSLPVLSTSIFTHLFRSPSNDPNIIGGYPGSARAFIDSDSGTTLTRAQTKHFALSLAYGLCNHPATGTRRGDVIMIYSPNSLSWPVALFGSIAAGLRCTLANSGNIARELAFQYRDSGARLVFTNEEGIAAVLGAFEESGISRNEGLKRIIVLDDGLEWAGGPAATRKSEAPGLLRMQDLLNRGALDEEEKFEGENCHETAYMCYSSGTTGKPKGVETTHQNVTTLLDIVQTTFIKVVCGVDSVLGVLPFYHIYGAIKVLHFPWSCGIAVVIQPRFDPEKFCASIERYKITIALVVPPVLVKLALHPAVDKYDVSSITMLLSGAAPLGAALVKQVTDRLVAKKNGKGKLTVLQGYGLTETSPTTHMLPENDALRKAGSIGILLPNLEARLVLDGDKRGNVEARTGDAAELWLRGPTIMKRYLNNSKATRESITPDGWLKTGDIVIRDSEGYYYVVDRQKELIKYKGFQVPPAELEGVLLTHPDISDAAVTGVESAKQATELPRAYIVHANPGKVKTDAAKAAFQESIQKWVQDKVARHKFLRGGVMVIDAIPKSAAGKILRRELRERAKIELAGLDPADLESHDGKVKL